MQESSHAQHSQVPSLLPWFITAGAFVVYLATLNHWVTVASVPYTSKVMGWDWSLPIQAPLFFALTHPLTWLPASWQTVALNGFTAACAALTLGLLARSVALLPHDRTHAQRQRERSEFSLLSLPGAWLAPLFAVLVCGLQLTYWEHATAATNEALSLLLFAYVIRCLLEYRIDHRESWLLRMALVYGLAVTNNWAMIAFFPLFLVALVWIKGFGFFQPGFLGRLVACGVLGLLPYVILPMAWASSEVTDVGFWEAFRAQLGNQKAYLLNTPEYRNRAFVLSLTSILPILIIGIRWPSSFGDTSAAGALVTNFMFRVVHVVFLGVCVWVAFDQQFSPRALGRGLPFLTFYYLGALAIGYFFGYVLLVFGSSKARSWKRRSNVALGLDRLVVVLGCVTCVAVPAGLVYKNLPLIRQTNGPLLRQFAESAAAPLPKTNTVVLSDDYLGLMLLQGHLESQGGNSGPVLIHSRSLPVPDYHRQLRRRYPDQWPNVISEVPEGEPILDPVLLKLLIDLSRTNAVYYLHPSFGVFFEGFYPEPNGLVCRMVPYPSNDSLPPPLNTAAFDTNQTFWTDRKGSLADIEALLRKDMTEAQVLGRYYSRALNFWGVEAQRINRLAEAAGHFTQAVSLNTNNKPAQINLEHNHFLRTGSAFTNQLTKIGDKFGSYSDWESMLVDNGPIDQPDYSLELGQVFYYQKLYRQAAIQFTRVKSMQPASLDARLALANVYLKAMLPDQALQELSEAKSLPAAKGEARIALARLEASAYFAKTNYPAAEKLLRETLQSFPNHIGALDALAVFYGQTQRPDDALKTIDEILRLAPNNPQALLNRATIHFNNRNYPPAQAALDQLLGQDPKNLPALLYKVFMQSETKAFDEALATADRILQLEPDHPEGLLYKGGVHIERKEFAKALPPLNRLLELQPGKFEALQNRAFANLQLENLTGAQRDYDALRTQVPRYYAAYYGLGEVAYRQKRTAEAIEFYELYLKYAPPDRPEIASERQKVTERLNELKRSAG